MFNLLKCKQMHRSVPVTKRVYKKRFTETFAFLHFDVKCKKRQKEIGVETTFPKELLVK